MPIAVSILGCEHPHAADALGVIVAEPDVRLAAVWTADGSAVPGPVSGYAVQQPDTAIDRADAVIVLGPVAQRAQLCLRAAQAGRPVLVEQPVAATAAEARAVAREIARHRTPADPNLFLRELPALARLAAVLRAGVLGRVSGVAASYLRPTAANGSARAAGDVRRSGGGMADLGIPLVDSLAALGARPRLDAVRFDRRRGDPVDRGGVAVGTWGDVPLTLRASWMARPGTLELVVNGAAATAVLRDGTLELTSEVGAPERWVGAPPDPAEAVRAFLERLRRRRLDPQRLEDAIRAQEAIERAAVL